MNQFYREIAVVIPNWSFRDEQYVYSCLRKLNAEKGNVKVNVFGMPLMVDSDKIGYNLYKNLHLKAVLEGYVNKDDEIVRNFRKRYHDTYHAIPEHEAFEGYDMMMYIGSNLNQHGTRFQYFLPDVHQQFLQTTYNMKPKFLDETILNEELERVDYFENGHIDVWEFRYNGFKKMN